GTVLMKDGTVLKMDGTVLMKDGTVLTVDGTVLTMDGTVVMVDVTVVNRMSEVPSGTWLVSKQDMKSWSAVSGGILVSAGIKVGTYKTVSKVVLTFRVMNSEYSSGSELMTFLRGELGSA
ncbi:MAG: hypothetical protein ABW185_03970, partial [Sedimenticola sp.]